MLKSFRASIAKKLFAFICISILVSVLPLFYITQNALKRFAGHSFSANEDQIIRMSNYYLSRIAREQAEKYDEILKSVKEESSILARQASSIYSDMDRYASFHMYKPSLKRHRMHPWTVPFFITPESNEIITAFWGTDTLSKETRKEIQAISHIKPLLIKSKEKIIASTAARIITTSDLLVCYTQDPGVKKQIFHLPPPGTSRLREIEYPRLFLESASRYRDITCPYPPESGLILKGISSIYDRWGRFKGHACVDVSVDRILNEINEEAFVTDDTSDMILFAFFTNQAGELIALPGNLSDLFGIKIDLAHFARSYKILKQGLKTSPGNKAEPATKDLKKLHELTINDENYILSSSALDEIPWRIVLVSRKKDLMASIEETRKALRSSLESVSADFMKHSSVILALSCLFIFLAIKKIIQPIRELTLAAQKITEGDDMALSPPPFIRRTDEIGSLTRSLDIMLKRLKASDVRKREYAQTLEGQVRARTLELEKANTRLSSLLKNREKEVLERTEDLKRLNDYLFFSEEEARRDIASDLHDGIAQTLSFCISKLKSMTDANHYVDSSKLREIQEVLEQGTKEIRSLVYELSPPILDHFDLTTALAFLVEESNSSYGCRMEYFVSGRPCPPVEDALKITLYRAVGELIINILKHSGEKKGQIKLRTDRKNIMIRVEDQGSGFDVEKISKIKAGIHGFGLYNLSERLKYFGAGIEIDSAPGSGTSVRIQIPLDRKPSIEQGAP
ncbi:ATP-binding protein [Desulfospira joergensenii]|uniref:ATP-binding protein n=1 Tax=Desulfospira joergensenii TaxID=53329 RepID=UPI0003B66841|nr:ATP-binding protein [Desulfospira joergensenii]